MWSSERFRNIVYQLALIAMIGLVGGYAVSNLIHNLESRSITMGFSYLVQEAGFDISESVIAYDPTNSYARAFFAGVFNTLTVAAAAICVASLLGLTLGIARLSPNWLLRQIATLYVESVRNVPLILQLLLWYGAITELMPPVQEAWQTGWLHLSQRGIRFPWPLPHRAWSAALFGLLLAVVTGIVWSRLAHRRHQRDGRLLPVALPVGVMLVLLPMLGWVIFGAPTEFSHPELAGFDFEGGKNISPEFTALFLGLSLYTAAFIAEIVRGGVLAVPRGQVEAAEALGLSRRQRMRLVILPQAMRVIIPPLTSQYLNLTKNSSLAVAIGYPDLVSISNTTLNQTGQAIEAIALMMAVYLFLSLSISSFMNWYNNRVRLQER